MSVLGPLTGGQILSSPSAAIAAAKTPAAEPAAVATTSVALKPVPAVNTQPLWIELMSPAEVLFRFGQYRAEDVFSVLFHPSSAEPAAAAETGYDIVIADPVETTETVEPAPRD